MNKNISSRDAVARPGQAKGAFLKKLCLLPLLLLCMQLGLRAQTVIDFETPSGSLTSWDGFEWVASGSTGTTNGYSFTSADGALRITNQFGVGNTTKRMFKPDWTTGAVKMTKSDGASFKLLSFKATRISWSGTINFTVRGFNGGTQVYSQAFSVSGSSTGNTLCTLSSTNSNTSVTRIDFVATPNSNGQLPEGHPHLDDITVTSGTTNVAVTGISVSGGQSVSVGGTTQFSATVSPSNATNSAVTWSSDATGIATVSSSGLVTGVSAGNTTIRATAQDGSGVVGTRTVTVSNATVLVTGISVSGTQSVTVGNTTQFSATVSPSNATNSAVTWSSDATGIATVSSSGLVTGVSAGSTTIRATAQDGSGVAGTRTVTVSGSGGGGGGSTNTVIDFESLTPSSGWAGSLFFNASSSSWSSSVNGYVFRSANSQLNSTYSNLTNNTTKTLYMADWLSTSLQMKKSDDGSFKLQSFKATHFSWLPNANIRVKGFNGANEVYSQDFTANDNATLTLSSTNSGTSVTRVEFSTPSNLGSSGHAILDDITVTSGSGGSGTVLVTGISISPSSTQTINQGATVQLSATVTPSNATNSGVTWSSSNTGVATVNSSGLVTASGSNTGTVTITATANDGSNVSATRQVSVQSAPVTTSRTNRIGINLGNSNRDYSAEKVYADAIKSSRQWNAVGNRGGGGPDEWGANVDANLWPTQDATLLVYADLLTNNNHGRYKLSFTGKATVRYVSAFTTADAINYSYDEGTNTSTAFIDITNANDDDLWIDFTSTQRNGNGGPTNTGVTNVKLMRPLTPGNFNETYPESQVFTTPFLNLLTPFEVLRYIKWMEIDLPPSGDIEWQDRTKWTFSTQYPKNIYNPTAIYNGWTRSPSWESVIKLANASNTDAWICLPVRADDNYLIQLATLFRDGNEDCEPLKPNLKLYVEYGNEIWNTGTYFRAWGYVKEQGAASSICTFDGETDQNTLGWRWQAKRSVDISNAFRQVFGDAAMGTRIRPVVCGQLVTNDANLRVLDFIDRYYNKRDSRSNVTTPRPVNYYIYSYGTSTYFNIPEDVTPATGLNINNFFSYYSTQSHYDFLKSQPSLAKMYGLTFVPYEGGPHPNYTGDEVVNRVAVIDPRMRQVQVDMHKEFNKAGGDDLVVYFSLSDPNVPSNPRETDGQFGLVRGDISNTDWPRYNAMLDIKNATPEPITNGSLVPFVRDGKDYSIKAGDGILFMGAGTTNLTANSSTHRSGYSFRVNSTSDCNLRVEYSTTTSGITMIVEVDGVVKGTYNVANTNGAATFTPYMNLNVTADRLHAVSVICTGPTGAVLSVVKVHMALGQVSNPVARPGGVPAEDGIANPATVSTVAVYPNPSNGQLKLNFTNAKGGTAVVRVYNTDGRLVKSVTKAISKGTNSMPVNITELTNGSYIMTVTTESGVTTHKIIKQ